MKAVQRGSGAPVSVRRMDANDWMEKKQMPSMIAELEMEMMASPSPAKRSLLKKKAEPRVEEDEGVVELADEEASVVTPFAASSVSSKKSAALVIASDDEVDEEAVGPERIEEVANEEEEEEGNDEEDTPEERKRQKREKRELAKTNQQLMIQTQLLKATTSEIPKKKPKKLDEFDLAQRLVGQLQNVVGRFVPDAVKKNKNEKKGYSERLYLSADIESKALERVVQQPRFDDGDDDDLIVVAEEPEIKLEKPKPKVFFRNDDLDAIFGEGQNQTVGSLPFDSTRVWVSQLPAFRGVNLWDLSVKLVSKGQEAGKSGKAGDSSSDEEFVGDDDELEDDADEVDDDDLEDEPAASAASANNNARDEDAESEVEEGEAGNPYDEDGDDNDDDDEPELVFSDEEFDARKRHPPKAAVAGASAASSSLPASSSVGDSSDASLNNMNASLSMGSLDLDQGIGFVLNQAIHSQQQNSQFKSPGPKSSQAPKSVVDILLTPKKPFVSPLPKQKVEEDSSPFVVIDSPSPTALHSSVRRSLSLSLDLESPPASPGRDGADAIAVPMSLLPATLPSSVVEEVHQPVVESAPVDWSVPIESSAASASVQSAAQVSEPKVPVEVQAAAAGAAAEGNGKGSSLVVDPVERAKKKASSASFLDRFLVRGDAAKKMVVDSLKSKPVASASTSAFATTTAAAATSSIADDIEDSDNEKKRGFDDVFDDENGDQDVPVEKASKKIKMKKSLLEVEAVESDGEGGEVDDGEEEEEDHDDEDDEEENEQGQEEEEKGSEEGVFSSEGMMEDAGSDAEGGAEQPEVVELTAAEAQEKEDMEALNRLRMEKDLAELNRIKDLYVLGQWKTEKAMSRRQDMVGMEDYIDDEFQPAWNSIYNRDAIRSRLKKRTEGAGDGANAAEGEGAQGDEDEMKKKEGGDDDGLGSSDDEEEYERKREKLKQSIQLAKINSIFGPGPEMSRGESSLGGFGGSSSLFLDAPPSSASMDITGMGENSRVSRLIENRRETSNAGNMSGMFGALARDKTADIDPAQRLAMRRSNSKLLLNEGTLKRARSSSSVVAAAPVVSLGGRQFFEAGGDSNAANSNSRTGGNSKAASTPKKQKTPQKKKTPQKTSLLARK